MGGGAGDGRDPGAGAARDQIGNQAGGAGHDQDGDPGFLLGAWHGFIFPVSFVLSLFTDNIAVYSVPNNGNWYDFGYVLGLMTAFGGAARSGAAASRARTPSAAGKRS